MPGERVHIRLRAGTVVLPALTAIGRAHQAAELDPDHEQVRVVGLGAIQRTCQVHSRGGKLQLGRDGSSSSASSGRQL
jgi:hypothetical protein